jgi:hypothetical protein
MSAPEYRFWADHNTALSASVASAQAGSKLEMAGFYLQCYETEILISGTIYVQVRL